MTRRWNPQRCKPLLWLGDVAAVAVGGFMAAVILLLVIRVGL